LEIGSAEGMTPASLKKKALCSVIPLRVAQTTRHKGPWELTRSFLNLSSEDFIVTALKKAEYEEAFLIRGFNASDKNVNMTIQINASIVRVEKVSLEEKTIAGIDVMHGNSFEVSVGRAEIASFMVYLDKGGQF